MLQEKQPITQIQRGDHSAPGARTPRMEVFGFMGGRNGSRCCLRVLNTGLSGSFRTNLQRILGAFGRFFLGGGGGAGGKEGSRSVRAWTVHENTQTTHKTKNKNSPPPPPFAKKKRAPSSPAFAEAWLCGRTSPGHPRGGRPMFFSCGGPLCLSGTLPPSNILVLPSPFFPEILLSRKPPETQGTARNQTTSIRHLASVPRLGANFYLFFLVGRVRDPTKIGYRKKLVPVF